MHKRMMDKSNQPSESDMNNAIGQPIADSWNALRCFLVDTYGIIPIYNSGGKKYGWNLQYRMSGRPLCEMYPEHGSFTALVVLGKSEIEQALERIETFGSTVRQALSESPRFHDGSWLYICVSDSLTCQQDGEDIKQLILIKKKPPRKKTNMS